VAQTRIVHPATTAPDGSVEAAVIETKTYDTLGRLIDEVDGEGDVKHHVYYGPADYASADDDVKRHITIDGHLRSTTVGYGEPDAATTTLEVNSRGAVLSTKDPRGGVTHFTRDARDLATEEKRVLTTELLYLTTYKYTAEGKVKRRIHE